MQIKFYPGAYLFQECSSLMNLNSQKWDPWLKVPPGVGYILCTFMSSKNPSISARFEPVTLESRGKHITLRSPETNADLVSSSIEGIYNITGNVLCNLKQ